MPDDDKPTNVFEFPGAKVPGEAVSEQEPFRAGAFLDKHGPGLFAPVETLTDSVLDEMLYRMRQHRALADMLIDLMENEIDRRLRHRDRP